MFRIRGFTLVELMVVIAIIGIMAALAVVGVGKYLHYAKTGEAKEKVGAITRAAHAAYARESIKSTNLPEGTEGKVEWHELCGSTTIIPGTVPQGKKYQPQTLEGLDYFSGDAMNGWKCLRFSITQPHYYQYRYTKDGGILSGALACTADCFEVVAMGDLDGDGITSLFGQLGKVTNTELKTLPVIHVEREDE